MKKPNSYIIFPLDVQDGREALRYVRMLRGEVGLFKVGLELFIKEGPQIITAIMNDSDAGIFLDLKLHDIPETMRRALRSASSLGARLVTVHCEQGNGFLHDEALKAKNTKVLGVTVLTSLNKGHMLELGYREDLAEDMEGLVLRKAAIARDAGCHGIVCSGREVAVVKRTFGPDFLAVTPGIRPRWSIVAGDDQQRIVTPAEAVRDGADYLVIGRPIRDAVDPVDACKRTAEEIASVL
jgi:orotidine-5'-phosphate decarboxylase